MRNRCMIPPTLILFAFSVGTSRDVRRRSSLVLLLGRLCTSFVFFSSVVIHLLSSCLHVRRVRVC